MPQPLRGGLDWNSPYVSKVMRRYGIHTRHCLSQRLSVDRATVYRAFDENWAGKATPVMIEQLKAHFHVNIAKLVCDVPQR